MEVLNSFSEDCYNCKNYSGLLERITFFRETSQRIMEKKPLDDLLNQILESSKLLIPSEASSLLLFDKETESLCFHIATGNVGKEIESKYITLDKGIAGWVAKNRIGVRIDDCYNDERFDASYDKSTGFKTKSMLCVPMIIKNELIGVLQLMNKKNDLSYSSQDFDFFKALASECAVAIENARLVEVEIRSEQIEYELSTARKIQQNLLPSSLPKFERIDTAFNIIPAKDVGGDYYNVFKIDENNYLFFICDVSGKSISAALIAATIYSFAETYLIINSNNFLLNDFVESMNKFLILSTTPDRFATAWFGLFNCKDNSLESINAGHTPTFYFSKSKNEIVELKTGGTFLGCFELPYNSEKIILDSGDIVLFYTDGISEAMNLNEEEFGADRIKESLLNSKDSSAEKIIYDLVERIIDFRKKAEQSDDITCGAIKRNV